MNVVSVMAAYAAITLTTFISTRTVEPYLEELLDMHTGRPRTERDYTRCCINTIDLLKMSTCFLETWWGLK
jgi:hypothetical protein